MHQVVEVHQVEEVVQWAEEVQLVEVALQVEGPQVEEVCQQVAEVYWKHPQHTTSQNHHTEKTRIMESLLVDTKIHMMMAMATITVTVMAENILQQGKDLQHHQPEKEIHTKGNQQQDMMTVSHQTITIDSQIGMMIVNLQDMVNDSQQCMMIDTLHQEMDGAFYQNLGQMDVLLKALDKMIMIPMGHLQEEDRPLENLYLEDPYKENQHLERRQ